MLYRLIPVLSNLCEPGNELNRMDLIKQAFLSGFDFFIVGIT
jgi:hypothetical protein